jgi:hypothetical protein
MIGLRVGPLAQTSLDEALGLAVGLGRIGFGPDVFEAEPLAEPAEGKRFVAGAVVGHHPLDLDAEAFVVGQSSLEEGVGTAFLLVGHDLGEGDARVIVDGDMDKLPAEPFAPCSPIALSSAIAGDAVANAIDPAELLDVDVDHLARMLALVAASRFARLQCTDLVEPEPPQDTADRCWRQVQIGGDLLAGVALAAKSLNPPNKRFRGRPAKAMRSRAAIVQSRQTFAMIAINPFANGPRADACGPGNCPRRLPALDQPHNPLSTTRREPGILVHVHPVLSLESEASTTSASPVRTGWTTY